MTVPHPEVDPGGLLEYSVVFTDRALNHMSAAFVAVMQELMEILKKTYAAHTVAVVPGGGSYGMESIVRQFARDRRCLIIRNGFFSYRWTQILDASRETDQVEVLMARPVSDEPQAAYAPPPVDEVVAAIREQRSELVFVPHVETASGIVLPDDYLRQIAEATHEVGGLLVLDCVASGALWVNMAEVGVDILLSAPQKGWSGRPCAGYVMFNETARAAIEETQSSSFAADLKKWLTICEGYAAGKHAYHATVPTDTLRHNLALMRETLDAGLENLRERQVELGTRVRALLAEHGFRSVAAEGFESPSVVVVHTSDPELKNASKFVQVGIQAAAGVPLMCAEPEDFGSFRLGLFGLDKWADVDAAVGRLADALARIREQD